MTSLCECMIYHLYGCFSYEQLTACCIMSVHLSAIPQEVKITSRQTYHTCLTIAAHGEVGGRALSYTLRSCGKPDGEKTPGVPSCCPTVTCIKAVEGGVLCDDQQQVGRRAAIDDNAGGKERLRLHCAVHCPLLALAKGAVAEHPAVQLR